MKTKVKKNNASIKTSRIHVIIKIIDTFCDTLQRYKNDNYFTRHYLYSFVLYNQTTDVFINKIKNIKIEKQDQKEITYYFLHNFTYVLN